MQSASFSEIGKQYPHNEDNCYADDTLKLWIVADGMGGNAAGEVASQTAVDTIVASVKAGQTLGLAIKQAHEEILKQASARQSLSGMATTVAALQFSANEWHLAWVGDSRIYCQSKHTLEQVSRDHSFVQDMVNRGILSAEEARTHPKKNLVTAALGQDGAKRLPIEYQIIAHKHSIQQWLLCSDGVHDMLPQQQISACLNPAQTPAQQSQNLLAAVMATEASDNLSAIIVKNTAIRPGKFSQALGTINRLGKTIQHRLSSGNH